MNIGINAVAAFKKQRTGVEEYTYQLIKHLVMLKEAKKHHFVLYKDKDTDNHNISFPDNFKIKQLSWPLPMWTQIRLALEMTVNKPDVLFIPVHVLPLIRPKNSIVTIHGLEFEYYPKMYPLKHLKYLRWSTKYALKNASKIIAVSENTKKDLVEMYNGNPEKIKVVYHGVKIPKLIDKQKTDYPYILYIGRLETRKNVNGLINAFNLLKDTYSVPHKLVLAGPMGYGYEKISIGKDIIVKGYISDEEKWQLLQNAEMYVLPSLYEGFGMSILEAQIVGCPVITSNVSSMPEVSGNGAILIDPEDIEKICEKIYKVISNQDFKKDLIYKGYENVKNFSWEKCAKETLNILTSL